MSLYSLLVSMGMPERATDESQERWLRERERKREADRLISVWEACERADKAERRLRAIEKALGEAIAVILETLRASGDHPCPKCNAGGRR